MTSAGRRGNQCLYWLHTHTPDGVIHIESPANRTFTLGDFFAIWGQPLSTTRAASAFAKAGSKLKVWVDGKPYAGDPAKIPLVAHADIVIEAGPPFPTPPKFTDWQQPLEIRRALCPRRARIAAGRWRRWRCPGAARIPSASG